MHENLLLSGTSDVDTVEDRAEVVRDDVLSAPERHERHSNDDEQSLQVRLVTEESLPSDTFLCPHNSHLDLFNLRQDERIVDVSVAVILRNDSFRLLLPSLGHEPTWRLRNKPGQAENNDGAQRLQERRDAPVPGVGGIHVAGTEAGPGDGDGAEIPERIEEGDECTAEARVCEFGEKSWAGAGDEGDAEAQNEA